MQGGTRLYRSAIGGFARRSLVERFLIDFGIANGRSCLLPLPEGEGSLETFTRDKVCLSCKLFARRTSDELRRIGIPKRWTRFPPATTGPRIRRTTDFAFLPGLPQYLTLGVLCHVNRLAPMRTGFFP